MSKKVRDNFDPRFKKPLDNRERCNNLSDIDVPFEGLITLQLSDWTRYEYKNNAWHKYITSGGSGDTINVLEYGVKGDGSNETAIIQTLLNTYPKLFFPKGTYKFDAIVVPSTVKELKGSGTDTIFTNYTAPLTTSYIKFDSSSDGVFSDFTIGINNATNPNATFIELSSINNCIISNIKMPNTSYFGVNAHDCINTIVKDCVISNWKQCGIYVSGTNSKNNIVTHNTITSGVGSVMHGIQCVQGKNNTVSDNIITGAGQFGCNLFLESNSIVKNNKISNTVKEGINVQDSNYCSVIGNDVKWIAPITSTDFGISLFGSDSSNTVNNTIVSNNIIAYSSKSGIALAENCHYNLIENNIIINPNQLNEAQGSGILVYGYILAPTYNTISNNKIINNEASTYLKYGVSEQKEPTVSLADYNLFKFNDCYGAIKTVSLANYKSFADGNTPDYWIDFSPVLTSSTGTIGNFSVLKAQYKLEGKKCYFYYQVRINDPGTGAGYSILNLPFEQNNNPFARFIVIGSESVTGKLLNVNVVNNKLNFKDYNNAYVGGANYIYTIQGYYEINNY